MKKKIALFTAAVLMLSLAVGCTGKQADTAQTTGATQQSSTQAATSAPTGDPLKLTDTKATLSVFASNDATTNMDEYEFTKWLEEKTNVHVDWNISSSADANQKLTLLMSSGDYTDIIFQPGWKRSELLMYAKQGVVIPLNDLIEKHATNLKKMFELYPSYKSDLTLSDGNIYCMGKAEDCYHCKVTAKMWIYKPWLDKLKLSVPTTTDEFAAMLKAFKTQDPNGNGKQDEIPLAGSPSSWNANPFTYLMGAFEYNGDPQKYMIVKDGKVTPSFTTEGYKNGLKYLNGLFKDKLMAAETFTQDGNQLVTMGTAEPHVLGAVPGGYEGCFSTITDGQQGDWLNWVAIPPLKGPDGTQYTTFYQADLFNVTQGIITDKCKDPDLAIRWLDLFYDNEMGMNFYYGPRGTAWDYTKEGEGLGTDGQPAKWKEIPRTDATKDAKWGWGPMGPFASIPGWHSAKLAPNLDTSMEALLYKYSKPYYDSIPKDDMLLPQSLMFDENDSKVIAEFEATVVKSYLEEMKTRFITGDADIDKDWDTYVKQLDQMGLQQYLQILQKAYDQKMSLSK